MGKGHLTYFKIENFKRFDSLELKDIGQFNLIVGDNNVGKTSLLEAMQVDFHAPEIIYNYHKTLSLRGIDLKADRVLEIDNIISLTYPHESYFDYLLKDKSKALSIKFEVTVFDDGVFIDSSGNLNLNNPGVFNFDFVKPDEFEVSNAQGPFKIKIPQLKKENQIIDLHQDDINYASQNRQLPIILTKLKKSEDIFNDFQKSIGKSRRSREEFVDNLKFIIPKIEEIQSLEIGGTDTLSIGIEGIDEFQPLTSFGEGTQRAVEILIEILKNKNARLFIDEVDTGIHYSRMSGFLKNIITLSHNNDVQLFLTTHSLECQQAFAEVFEDPDMVTHQPKVKQYSLIEQPDGQVVANLHNYEQLQYALEIGFETRGGKRGW